MFYFDSNYLLLVLIPSLVLTLGAQLFVSAAYNRWGQVRNSANLTGAQVAQQILSRTSLSGVNLEGTPGKLSDHYDPTNNTVRMSQDIATVPSVAAMAVVAHELGHAQQYQEGSALIQARSFLVPAMRFSPSIAYLLILGGVFLNAANLIYIGALVYGVIALFSLLTVPVEFDASRRGLRLLQESGLMQTEEERGGARQVLTAAGLTYVAAMVSSLLTMFYYLSLANRRR